MDQTGAENEGSRVIMNELKEKAAQAALEFIEDDMILGVGTGSTVNYFIDALSSVKHRIDACVASSNETQKRLQALGLPVIDLNVAKEVHLYIDGADEVNRRREMVKGGGGAATREKIIANVAKEFICIVDESKLVEHLGRFPIAVEVLPIARSFVARELVKLGGNPEYREAFITDNGNIILDVYDLNLDAPETLENAINLITGVVENGLFARRKADKIMVATALGVSTQ